MKSEHILILVFVLIVISVILNRIAFFSFFKENGLNTKPIITQRNLFISEIVKYYTDSRTLTKKQNIILIKLRRWEIINFTMLPLLFILALIIGLIG